MKDINEGKITKEDALELLTCLWIKTLTINKVRSQSHTLSSAGSPMYQNVTIGGPVSYTHLIDKKHPMVTDGVLSDAGKKIMGYEAYISREAIQPLSDKLTELEMMDLYREIEIPTMFALHDRCV